MLKKCSSIAALIITGFLWSSCTSTKIASTGQGIPSLKETYSNDFAIGAALNADQILQKDPKAAALIPRQFDAITPENIMKAEVIHPGWNKYNFRLADKIVRYGKKHNIRVNGHTLIWHSQLPPYMLTMKSADSVRQYFTNHITTIASRYDGKVYSWDVVNEALNEDGTMRKSIFQQKLGDDYIVDAFRLAQEAAPHTMLYLIITLNNRRKEQEQLHWLRRSSWQEYV